MKNIFVNCCAFDCDCSQTVSHNSSERRQCNWILFLIFAACHTYCLKLNVDLIFYNFWKSSFTVADAVFDGIKQFDNSCVSIIAFVIISVDDLINSVLICKCQCNISHNLSCDSFCIAHSTGCCLNLTFNVCAQVG